MTMNYEGPMNAVAHMFRIEGMQTKDLNGAPDSVEFYPYIEAYSESFDSNWNTEDVYGRLDGINNFNSIRRSITLTRRIVAADLKQAIENQFKISKMVRFLYPAISKKDNINNIRSAPVLRLKLTSLIEDAVTHQGLYGFVQGGFSIQPIHEGGYFTPVVRGPTGDAKSPVRDESIIQKTDGMIFYKYVDISFTFHVIHNHLLGHDVEDTMSSEYWNNYFPYNVGKADFDSSYQSRPQNYTDNPTQSEAREIDLEPGPIDQDLKNRILRENQKSDLGKIGDKAVTGIVRSVTKKSIFGK